MVIQLLSQVVAEVLLGVELQVVTVVVHQVIQVQAEAEAVDLKVLEVLDLVEAVVVLHYKVDLHLEMVMVVLVAVATMAVVVVPKVFFQRPLVHSLQLQLVQAVL